MRIKASEYAKNGGKMAQMFEQQAKMVPKKKNSQLMDQRRNAVGFTLIFTACMPELHLLLLQSVGNITIR